MSNTIDKIYYIPSMPENYYGQTLSVSNIDVNSYIWIGNNRNAELYKLISKEVVDLTVNHSDIEYRLSFERSSDKTVYHAICNVNTRLSVKTFNS